MGFGGQASLFAIVGFGGQASLGGLGVRLRYSLLDCENEVVGWVVMILGVSAEPNNEITKPDPQVYSLPIFQASAR